MTLTLKWPPPSVNDLYCCIESLGPHSGMLGMLEQTMLSSFLLLVYFHAAFFLAC